MSTIVVMPGGFHPFHAGHAALYNSARRAFPDAEVYVAATNDTSTRPFPFAVKEKLAKLAGVEPGHFVQVKSPFRAEEITSQFNPDVDSLIFVRSEKDKTKPPQAGGNKKDGSPAYLQPLLSAKRLEPFGRHAYMAYLPTVEFGPGMTSATEIRNAWPTLNEKRKTALVMSLYPKTQTNPRLAATVVKMLDTAMGSEQGVAEGIEDNYNKNDAGIKAALQTGVKLIPVQSNNDATGKPIYIHDYSGRYTVVVDMGEISVPFYVSTGLGGKAGVAVDKWYPFFGIGPDGWINKGSEATINDFYGSNKLKRVAQVLDNTLGLPSRAKNVSGWPGNRGDGNYFISAVNRGLDPAALSDRSTKLRDNMLSVLRGLGEPNKYVEKAAPVQAARPKAYAFDKNNPEHVAAFDATSKSEREIAMALAKDPKSQGVAEGLDKKEATRRIQKMLNDKYKANLDVDGILGPLTLKSINKFIPDARTELADEPNKTTAVQGKKVKEQNVAEMDGQNFVGGMTASYQDQENQPIDEDYIDEKWSQKYKSSINCASPRGFSQRAHCAGRKK